jgi:hypothetical protein
LEKGTGTDCPVYALDLTLLMQGALSSQWQRSPLGRRTPSTSRQSRRADEGECDNGIRIIFLAAADGRGAKAELAEMLKDQPDGWKYSVSYPDRPRQARRVAELSPGGGWLGMANDARQARVGASPLAVVSVVEAGRPRPRLSASLFLL